jgi:hypothetical protein
MGCLHSPPNGDENEPPTYPNYSSGCYLVLLTGALGIGHYDAQMSLASSKASDFGGREKHSLISQINFRSFRHFASCQNIQHRNSSNEPLCSAAYMIVLMNLPTELIIIRSQQFMTAERWPR